MLQLERVRAELASFEQARDASAVWRRAPAAAPAAAAAAAADPETERAVQAMLRASAGVNLGEFRAFVCTGACAAAARLRPLLSGGDGCGGGGVEAAALGSSDTQLAAAVLSLRSACRVLDELAAVLPSEQNDDATAVDAHGGCGGGGPGGAADEAEAQRVLADVERTLRASAAVVEDPEPASRSSLQ